MEIKIFNRSKRKFKGQGLVEFALVIPILLLLVFGIIEAGRLLFIYSAVLPRAGRLRVMDPQRAKQVALHLIMEIVMELRALQCG